MCVCTPQPLTNLTNLTKMQTYNSFNELASAQSASPLVSDMSVFNGGDPGKRLADKINREFRATWDAVEWIGHDIAKFEDEWSNIIKQEYTNGDTVADGDYAEFKKELATLQQKVGARMKDVPNDAKSWVNARMHKMEHMFDNFLGDEHLSDAQRKANNFLKTGVYA